MMFSITKKSLICVCFNLCKGFDLCCFSLYESLDLRGKEQN